MEAAKERLASGLGQAIFKQRKTLIEGIFALGKQWHGLRRTPFRGKWKVQIHFWLIAATLNIKRALKEIGELKARPNPSPDQTGAVPSPSSAVKTILISISWLIA